MNTQQTIFTTAVDIIEHHGSTALTMRRLAGKIGLTPMALYRHYKNRDRLLTAVAEQYFSAMAARWQAYAADNPYDRALALIGADLIQFSLEHPHIYRLMFIEPRADARTIPKNSGDNESPTFSIVVACVQRGITDGALHGGSAPEIALALASQVHGLVALRQGGRLHMSDADFRTCCEKAFVRAISAYKTDTN